MANPTALIANHPEVGVVLGFLIALALHVVVGALLHAVRLHDFDWRRLGQFVETDMATTRGVTILATFLLTLATTALPGQSWRAAFTAAFAALLGSCASATIPIVRDTVTELVQLFSGVASTPAPTPAAAGAIRGVGDAEAKPEA